MSIHSRLQRAFARTGISLAYRNGVFHVQDDQAEAHILLPESLPLEDKAVRQLLAFAAVRRHDGSPAVCRACATPDFHPGTIAPVGSVVATPPDFVIPAAIGTDINCSVRLLTTGAQLHQLAPHKERLVNLLTDSLLKSGRDVPVATAAFRALFDEGPGAFVDRLGSEGIWACADMARLRAEIGQCIGLRSFGGSSRHAPHAYLQERHAVFRDPCLGTVGSGNHFVEFQVVEDILDRHAAYKAGLRAGDVVVMIHSGSRDVGFFVGQAWMDRAKAQWPRGMKHPSSRLYGLSGPLADEYLQAMGVAARYAWANRVVLAELVRKDLEQAFGASGSRLVVDVPHNVVLRENSLNIHRKGATPAKEGDFALIPGSMGDASYLVTGLGSMDWLQSCSHGAGRSMRRQAMRALRPESTKAGGQDWQCVTLREERRIEEAPQAYKPIGPVIDSQEKAGLLRAAVRLKPWMTFKA